MPHGLSNSLVLPHVLRFNAADGAAAVVVSVGSPPIPGDVEAARKAINSPLLEDVSIAGAKGVLINIAADSNLTLFEVNEAMSLIHEATGPEATIIFGTVIDDSLDGDIRVTVIATGFNLAQENAIPFRSREQQQGGPVHAVNAAGAVHSAIPEPPAFENPPLTENPHVAAAGQAVETPTYMRNNNPSAQGEMSADNLDIPTFLRRKMNA